MHNFINMFNASNGPSIGKLHTIGWSEPDTNYVRYHGSIPHDQMYSLSYTI